MFLIFLNCHEFLLTIVSSIQTKHTMKHAVQNCSTLGLLFLKHLYQTCVIHKLQCLSTVKIVEFQGSKTFIIQKHHLSVELIIAISLQLRRKCGCLFTSCGNKALFGWFRLVSLRDVSMISVFQTQVVILIQSESAISVFFFARTL